jgi:predicted MPP superfamily phosphohydrolase
MMIQTPFEGDGMKLAIVHLSDIHIRSRHDICFRRRDKLSNRITFSRDPEEEVFLVVTGDVANTGSKEEYEYASEYFTPLFLGLGLSASQIPSRVAFVPGNHDCNFEDVGDLRPRVLTEIESQLEAIDVSGETVRTLLQVQSNFFAFQESITGEQIPVEQRLYSAKMFDLAGKRLEIRCFNSAWLSRRHEDPGSLGFPMSTITTAGLQTDSDIVLTIVHHPSNWLSPSAHHSFRRVVQQSSDFLFTGHEHSLGGQVISTFQGSSLVHFESGPLQPLNSGESEFGILHIDLESRTWSHDDFAWSNGGYARIRVIGPNALSDKSERVASLQISRDFVRHLNETGTGFLHPRKHDLSLSDIYVYPDLKTRKLSQRLTRTDELPKDLPSHQVLDKLLAAHRVVIAGPSDSGKTALSKMLYLDANTRHGRFCVLLQGNRLSGKDPALALSSSLDAAINEQYGDNAGPRYAGLSPGDRILVIDNWEDIQFNRQGRAAIINRASQSFGCIVIFVDDIFLMEELSPRHAHAPLAEFEVADLREFGFRLRGQLIRKWHHLGNEFIDDEEIIARSIADSTRVIDTVLGRNLLPSYPVNILTLLQTYDAGAGTQNGGLGSYGQVYEALITARLAKVSLKSIDIGTKITFLSRFAWRLFGNHQRCLSESEWDDLGREYFNEYRIRVDVEHLREACHTAGIISADDSGIRFAYGYEYCYFVAKYFQENLADLDDQAARTKLFDLLKAVSECVYNQDNANIVVFYIFLTTAVRLNLVVSPAS